MGVRISAYAVDLPRLDAFLNASMAELLCRYARDGHDPDRYLFHVVERDTHATFCVAPDRSIVGPYGFRPGEGPAVLTASQLEAAPFLQRPARALISGNAYQASWLLRAFGHCAGIDFIHPLIEWHRRWWIGSVLQTTHALFDQTSFDDLVLLFRKLLRGWNCGYPIPRCDVGVNAAGLPFTPEDNPDLRLGRWDEHESFSAFDHLSLLLTSVPTFTPPPDFASDPGESDWNGTAWDNVVALADVWNLDYRERNILSFIG
jgi:hypothetical protein